MMDYEDLIDSLQNEFDAYCDYNEIDDATDTHYERFIDMAEKRIEDMMTGGLDMKEAYDRYREEEMTADLEFILKAVED